MSKNKSEREFIFTLWQKENLNVLTEILDMELSDAKLEIKKHGLKIDMHAWDSKTEMEVFVENTLTPSNFSHQERLLRLIKEMDGGTIIYQAIKFKGKHIKELEQAVKQADKPLCLVLLEISQKILPVLDELNYRTHKLNVFNRLHLLNTVTDPISVAHTFQNDKVSISHPKKDETLSVREQNNLFLLQKLREKIPYFYSFQRHKSNMDTNRIISFGLGANDVNLFVSLENRTHQSLVEIRTGRNNRLYESLKAEENNIKTALGNYSIVFKDEDNSIGCYFEPYQNNIQQTATSIAEIVENFIKTFSDKILYPNGEFKLHDFSEKIHSDIVEK